MFDTNNHATVKVNNTENIWWINTEFEALKYFE